MLAESHSNSPTAFSRLAQVRSALIGGLRSVRGNAYRVRAMDVNTALDDFDAVIASHGSGLLAEV